jgi:hypothetical protein
MLVESRNASPQVAGAIRQAATSTGTSFDYLLTTAQIESNFNSAAKAVTSSAQGLYQFIDQTWLGTMKAVGSAVGLGQYAAAIERAPDGRFEVSDPATRKAILDLRSDPSISAVMAGVYARGNADQLREGLGRAPTGGELYIAHFLGAEGAVKLISAAARQPNSTAADQFPQAAAANRPIFYDKAGNARSAIDVYRTLTQRYDVARASVGPELAGAPLRGTLPANPNVAAPDTAGVTNVYAQASALAYAPGPVAPAFQSIFSDPSPSSRGVGSTVRSLWTRPGEGETAAVRPTSLFSD